MDDTNKFMTICYDCDKVCFLVDVCDECLKSRLENVSFDAAKSYKLMSNSLNESQKAYNDEKECSENK